MPEQELNPWLQAIAKLTELTQSGRLKWGVLPPTHSNTSGPEYVSEYGEKRLRLRKLKHRDSEGILIPRVFGGPPPITLEFVDDEDNGLWTFPETQAIKDLYSAVQYQAAGVRGFLEELLGEK